MVLFVVNPQFFSQLITASFQFFGQAPVTNTVQEARGWTLAAAWVSFNYGLILMIGGGLISLYLLFRENRPHDLFALIWSAVMFYATWQHIRYEYYLAVNVALLSAVCVSCIYTWGRKDIARLTGVITRIRMRSPNTLKSLRQNEKSRRNPEKNPGLLRLITLSSHWWSFRQVSAFFLHIPPPLTVTSMHPVTRC